MDIKQFYDVKKRTQTEQVLKNQEDIDALKDKDTDIEQSISDEANARVQADESLAYDIAELQNQIEGLGNVFTLKGSVATYNDLPVTDNHIGDVWYVEAQAVGYVWIDDNGIERWEQLGLPIDLSDYVTTSDLALALEDYQEKLTAGTNISIIDNVISASGGSDNAVTLETEEQEFEDSKTLKLKNGKNLKIENENRGDITFLPYNSSYFSVDLMLTHKTSGGRGSGVRALSNKMQLLSGQYKIDVPNSNGTLALTTDIPQYGYQIVVRFASNVVNGKFYACVNGKWYTHTSTSTISNCSEIILSRESIDSGDSFDPNSQASVFIDDSLTKIYPLSDSAQITIMGPQE